MLQWKRSFPIGAGTPFQDPTLSIVVGRATQSVAKDRNFHSSERARNTNELHAYGRLPMAAFRAKLTGGLTKRSGGPSRAALERVRTKSEQSAMDNRDCLAHYPFVVVRIACRVCSRRGSYRLARLAAKFGPEISLRDLTDHFSYDCLWRAEARSRAAYTPGP
jgi:hypothetical protein